MLASLMLTSSAAWLEVSIAQTRHAANVHEHVRATQAADSALTLCADALRAGVAPVLLTRRGEPPQWTKARTFDGPGAYEPVPSWPGSARPPQCVVEAAHFDANPDARGYWITARGFGANEAAQARVQLMIMHDAGRERRAWRRVVIQGDAW
jgi:hypothetical protein